MDFRDLAGLTGSRYLRKSRKDSESETTQEVLSKHKKELDEFATRWKLNIVDTFQEVVSGDKIQERPEVQKLLKNIDDLKYEFVLVMDLDRLGRGDMEDQGKILSTFKETDTFIVTPRKIYDLNDELDEEVSEMETFFARRELKLIKRRLNRGRLRSARDGKFIASIPPFGYDRNSDCVLIENKDTQLVQQIYNWFVNGDESGQPMGAFKIARRLSLMNIPTPTGKKLWQPNTILKILTNQVYVGRIIWKPRTLKRDNQLTDKRSRDSEKIDVVGKHEPIIEQEIFDRAQIILKERLNPKLGIRKNFRNPFLGIGVCGVCGRHMQVKKPGGNRQVQYRCVSVGCSNVSSTFKLVEDDVLLHLKNRLEELESILESQKIEDGYYSENKQENPYPRIIEQTEKELVQLEEQEDNLDNLLEKGIYDIEKYSKRSQKLRSEIKSKKESLKEFKEQSEIISNSKNSLFEEIKALTNITDMYYKTSDISKRNRLIKSYVAKIIYFKKKNENFQLDIKRRQI